MSKFVQRNADLSLAIVLFVCVGLLSTAFIVSSCAVTSESTATNTTDGSGSGTDTNTVAGNTIDNGTIGSDIVVNAFEITVDENTEYTTVWSRDGDRDGIILASEWGEKCIAADGEWIQCIVELDEEDIWMHGYTLNAMLPGDMCAYRSFQGYYYAIAKVGEMPYAVRYHKDETAGTVDNVLYFYHSVAGNNPGVGTGGIAPPAYVANEIETEADILCPWDYSKRHSDYDGKNCCVGKYKAYVDNSIAGNAIAEPGDDVDWGGSLSNCAKGPAIDDSFAKGAKGPFEGLPAETHTEVIGNGYGEKYVVGGGEDAMDEHGNSTIYWSNYFSRADHTGDCPDSADNTGGEGCPEPVFQVAITPNGSPVNVGFPYYRFECLDHNFEIVARIDVLVREWNTKGQMDLEAAGDPDVSGVASGTFSASDDLNDYPDWLDRSAGAAACYPSDSYRTWAPNCAPLEYY